MTAKGSLVADGEVEVAHFDASGDGLLLWAVTHSVFGMKTTKSANIVLQFIQNACLDVHEAQTVSCKKAGQRLMTFLGLSESHA